MDLGRGLLTPNSLKLGTGYARKTNHLIQDVSQPGGRDQPPGQSVSQLHLCNKIV